MGKLTLLGGLRGTKLKLKGTLEEAKRAPREPPSAIPMFDSLPRGRNFGPGGAQISNLVTKLLVLQDWKDWRTGTLGSNTPMGSANCIFKII